MHEFEVEDAEGETHTYKMTPFGAREGLRQVQQLAKVSSGPIGEAIGSFARDSFMDNDASLSDALESGAEKVEQSDMDWSKAIYQLASSAQFDKIAFNLCSKVVRDDSQQLTNGKTFDRVYRQNFGELIEVLIEVLKVNGFLPIEDTSSIVDRLSSIAARVRIGGQTGVSDNEENELNAEQTGSSSGLLHTNE